MIDRLTDRDRPDRPLSSCLDLLIPRHIPFSFSPRFGVASTSSPPIRDNTMRAVILALALVFGVAVAGRSDKAAYARGMVEDLDCESWC